MLILDKTAPMFCRGVIGFSFKACKNSFSQSALLGANWNSEHWEVRFMFLEAFP